MDKNTLWYIADAPAVQQRMMDAVLVGIKQISALAYLVSIVIYNKTFQEHFNHFESLFEKCQNGNLQLISARSTLCKAETTY